MRTVFAGILGLSSFLCAAQTQEPMPQQPLSPKICVCSFCYLPRDVLPNSAGLYSNSEAIVRMWRA